MPIGPIELDSLQAIERPAESSHRLFFSRDFGWLWWGQLVSQVGDGITRLALLWYVYSVTGSAIQTTVVGLLQTLPPVIFGPLIGVYLDRLPKKSIMIASDLLRAVIIGLVPCMIPVGVLKVDHLFVLVFLNSIASTIFGPAMIASVPFIVPRAQFTAANRGQCPSPDNIESGRHRRIYLERHRYRGLKLAKSAVRERGYLCSVGRLPPLRADSLPRTGPRPAHPAGIHGHRSGRRGAVCFQAIYSFGMSAFSTLFPILGKNLLGLGPAEIGYLWSSLGIGLFAVSIALLRMSDWHVRERMQAIAVSSIVTGLALCALVGTSNRVVAGVLLCLIGAGIGLFTPVAWGVLQEIAPQGMVGRLLTLYGAAAMAAAMVGMTFLGWILQKFGESVAVLGIGLVLFVTAMMAGRLSRRSIYIHRGE
ncbi:MAG: MFS transporter [Nitrospirae bacterium]|nr:MAG: MFS transporter [Nitrospirota bacterium]